MAEFKIVLSDQKTGRSYKVDVGGGAAGALIGKRIGDEVDAGIFGLPGYRMEITGGQTGTALRHGGISPLQDGGRSSSPVAQVSSLRGRGSGGERASAVTRSLPISCKSMRASFITARSQSKIFLRNLPQKRRRNNQLLYRKIPHHASHGVLAIPPLTMRGYAPSTPEGDPDIPPCGALPG